MKKIEGEMAMVHYFHIAGQLSRWLGILKTYIFLRTQVCKKSIQKNCREIWNKQIQSWQKFLKKPVAKKNELKPIKKYKTKGFQIYTRSHPATRCKVNWPNLSYLTNKDSLKEFAYKESALIRLKIRVHCSC